MTQLTMRVLGDPPPPGSRHRATLARIDGLDEPLDLAHGPCLRLVFTFEEARYRNREASVLTSTALNEHSRLCGLLTAMLGRTPADGEEVTGAVRALVGQSFVIAVEHRHPAEGDAVFLEAVAVEREGG